MDSLPSPSSSSGSSTEDSIPPGAICIRTNLTALPSRSCASHFRRQSSVPLRHHSNHTPRSINNRTNIPYHGHRIHMNVNQSEPSDCSKMMLYLYPLAIISSGMLVIGIYYSLTRLNAYYFLISLFGLLLIALGACAYCVYRIRLNRGYRRKTQLTDISDSRYDSQCLGAVAAHVLGRSAVESSTIAAASGRHRHALTTPAPRSNTLQAPLVIEGATCSSSQEAKSTPNREIALSQLSLNMIPQYFADSILADDSQQSDPLKLIPNIASGAASADDSFSNRTDLTTADIHVNHEHQETETVQIPCQPTLETNVINTARETFRENTNTSSNSTSLEQEQSRDRPDSRDEYIKLLEDQIKILQQNAQLASSEVSQNGSLVLTTDAQNSDDPQDSVRLNDQSTTKPNRETQGCNMTEAEVSSVNIKINETLPKEDPSHQANSAPNMDDPVPSTSRMNQTPLPRESTAMNNIDTLPHRPDSPSFMHHIVDRTDDSEINEADIESMSMPPPSYESLMGSLNLL